VEQQARFVEKQKLTFPVLSDSEGEVRAAYGVGKTFLGLINSRVTFFIDGDGIIRDILDRNINYGAHVKFVIKWLETISTNTGASKSYQKNKSRQFWSFATLTFVADDDGDDDVSFIQRVSSLPPQL